MIYFDAFARFLRELELPHPTHFEPGDPNRGRQCVACGTNIPAGCRYVHADWCRSRQRAARPGPNPMDRALRNVFHGLELPAFGSPEWDAAVGAGVAAENRRLARYLADKPELAAQVAKLDELLSRGKSG